jgi:hypothetical protein
VSCRTVKSRLKEEGYRRCVVSKKKRSRFCRHRLQWTVDD